MSRMTVDTSVLTGLAARIRAAAQEAEEVAGVAAGGSAGVATVGWGRPGGWSSGGPGSAALAAGVGAFLAAWHTSLAEAVGDARWVADGLETLAGAYHDAERAIAAGPLALRVIRGRNPFPGGKP